MSADDPAVRGADAATIREAIDRGDPFPGTTGFAGAVDGRLVRDVLGRVPLYYEAGGPPAADPGDEFTWSSRPSALAEPVAVPAGFAVDSDGERRLWSLPDPEPEPDREAALTAVAAGFETAVETVTAAYGEGDIAVAFSGGVDSALVAQRLDAPCYAVGFEGSHDLEAARTAAEVMGLDLTAVELDPSDLERAVPEVAHATGRTNAMDVAIALPLFLAGERAAADGYDALAVGQGGDELFGGYEKVVRLDHRVEAATVRGAVREQILTLPEQLPRDVLALETAGVDPVAPLLHDRVVEAAIRLPTDLLADETERKIALRRVAREHLPESVADRSKKAVQYGSLVARELDRLARQAGYKRRMDDHVTRYVESLLESTG